MPGFLRQATASQARAIGPFVSDSDFKTVQTGLTIANTDIKLIVNGAASANKNSGGGTHRANGVYGLTFDATDTATVGEMEVSVVVAGALVVFDKFFVVEEAVFDALFVASAPGYVVDQPVNATKLGGTSLTGRDIGASVLLSSGTGTGQVKLASGYVAPNWGDVGNPTTVVGLTGTTVKTATDVETDTQDIQSRLPAALTGAGNIKADAQVVSDKTGYALTAAYDPAKTASQAGDAMALTSGERDSVADALLDRADAVETSLTPRGALRLALAALAGKLSGAATTTVVIRNVGDSKDRITATVDSNGNRTAVTTDVT